MSPKVNGYGAVATSDESMEHGDASFDPKNAYYLKDSDKHLTTEQRCRKVLLVAFPIIVAVIIVGGAAYFLFRDFNHLYPSHGGGRDKTHRMNEPHIVEPVQAPAPSPSEPAATSKDEGNGELSGGACAAHSKCADLGLIGDCCPTADGVFLGCC